MATRLRGDAFREMSTDGKTSLFVSYQSASHSQSMRILADNGLRPLTYREALSFYSELIKKLQGNKFYLADRGIKEKDGFYTLNAQKKLVKATGDETYDQKIHIWHGNRSLILNVNSDYSVNLYGARFNLIGDEDPRGAALVVVGVKTPLGEVEESMEKGREALRRLRREIQG